MNRSAVDRLAGAPRRAAERMQVSFRARLLFALVGTVGLLLAVTLTVVRLQTRQQVRVVVDGTVARTNRVYEEQENARKRLLSGYAARFAGNNRFAVLVDEVLSGTPVDELLGNMKYELDLAGIPGALLLVTDPSGEPLAGRIRDQTLPDPRGWVPAAAPEAASGPLEGTFSYHAVAGALVSVQTVPLILFDAPVGTLTVGLPLDDAVAQQLGASVGADVCFVGGGRCVAATPEVRRGGLEQEMLATARTGQVRRIEWRGRRLALVPERLDMGGGAGGVSRVVAIRLDDALRPFDQLERAQALAGLGALLLALLIGVVLSRSFAGPVRALVGATRRISAGDLETRVEVASRDELGTLAEAFNEMAYGLMLKERYRGVLDKVVSREVADELLKGDILLGGETREVTTLFADVRGFTSITEGMPPQQVITLLNELVGRMGAAVEEEGGVVDKFLGDGLMAIFGAPMAQEDHALRAVRAALRMREAVAEANLARNARGEESVDVGIGVNTGPAVAGNMGSPGRLNYTVLGESVNVSSRLCSTAGRGEILISQATLALVDRHVEAVPAGERTLKGLSAPVPVFRVERLRAARGPAGAVGAAATALALALLASPVPAQPLPTLAELGVTWSSPSGFLQVTPGGRLELEAHLPREDREWLVPGTEPALGGRARLFVDAFAGSRWFASAAVHVDRARPLAEDRASVRVEQAFLRWLPLGSDRLTVQAGQFVTPFGAYPQRHNTPSDPFVRPPLPYDYRTMVSAELVPGTVTRFVQWKDEPERFRPLGAPPVWAVPYPTGVMVAGRAGRLDARVAALNSAPSSEVYWWRYSSETGLPPTWVAQVGLQLSPEARVGVSYNRGPYLDPEPENGVPAGSAWQDYDQELWSFEGSLSRGRVEARGEVILDRWEVPNLGQDPRDLSVTVEGKAKLSPALFVVGRYGAIRFNELEVAGAGVPWDYGVDRAEIGGGLRLGRNTELRAEYAHTWTAAPPTGDDGMFAVRWTYIF